MPLSSPLAQFADRLFEVGAIQFGSFPLKLHERCPGAPLSLIYLNLRTPDNPKPGPLTADLIGVAGRLLYEMATERGLCFTRVAGVPRAGDPLAKVVAYLSKAPVVQLVKGEVHGVRRVTRVDFNGFGIDHAGQLDVWPGETILLADDLITSADSKLEAIEVLKRDIGLDVSDLVVLVDREQGGVETLAKQGVRTHALLTLTGLLDYYLETGRIDQETRENVLRYLAEAVASC